nr:hypothetical protein [uncultured Desulfuromonas sp.]
MTIAKVKIKLYVKKLAYHAVAVFIFSMTTSGWANGFNGLDGEWDWDKDNSLSVFSIRLVSHENGLLASYCAVALSGRRIDCAPTDDAKEYPLW